MNNLIKELALLSEAFDKPAKFEVQSQSPTYFSAVFEINGKKYRMICERSGRLYPFDVRFEQGYGNKSMDILGTGDSQEVFATVMTILDKFIVDGDYPPFTFFAMNNEPSRVKLYDRLAKRMASKYKSHYSYTNEASIKDGHRKQYFFITDDLKKEFDHWRKAKYND